MKSFHTDLISSCQSALNNYDSCFSKCLLYVDARFQMMNNKCHNWGRLKTPSTLQSIRMNKKSMMDQAVCAVKQSVNLSCFKAQTCEWSAGPTLLGLQDPVAALTSAARIRLMLLLRSVFLISSHPSLAVVIATF